MTRPTTNMHPKTQVILKQKKNEKKDMQTKEPALIPNDVISPGIKDGSRLPDRSYGCYYTMVETATRCLYMRQEPWYKETPQSAHQVD